MITLHPISGLGEVVASDDLAAVLVEGIHNNGLALEANDVLVVTHKVVSKSEGRLQPVADDREYRNIVESEASSILRRRGDLTITETTHGFICANAGVDRSNVAPGWVVLLPVDPDGSAHRLRNRLTHLTGIEVAVIISDTFGRAWRRGLIDVAIGVAGLQPINDLKGTTDTFGRTLEVTEIAVADELAAAAELAMGKSAGIPAVIVRGYEYRRGGGSGRDMVRSVEEDLFR